MTSVNMLIGKEARRLLADQYMADNKPWFAHDIMKGQSKQFDASLRVISDLLNR